MKRLTINGLCLLCICAILTACAMKKESDDGSVEKLTKTSILEVCDEETRELMGKAVDGSTPVSLLYLRNYECGEEYQITDGETIEAVLQALLEVSVEEEEEMYATDSDDIFIFTMEDGAEFTVSFNHHCFKADRKLYQVSGAKGLWELADSITE